MTQGRSGMANMAAALLALVLLSFASIQSLVMRANLSSDAMPMCGGAMAGMAMGATPADRAHAHDQGLKPGHKATCPYCAAAAHPSIVGQAILPRYAAGFSFAAYRSVAQHGPRGPPGLQPHARGPPFLL